MPSSSINFILSFSAASVFSFSIRFRFASILLISATACLLDGSMFKTCWKSLTQRENNKKSIDQLLQLGEN